MKPRADWPAPDQAFFHMVQVLSCDAATAAALVEATPEHCDPTGLAERLAASFACVAESLPGPARTRGRQLVDEVGQWAAHSAPGQTTAQRLAEEQACAIRGRAAQFARLAGVPWGTAPQHARPPSSPVPAGACPSGAPAEPGDTRPHAGSTERVTWQSSSPWEKQMGYARAVRHGAWLGVSGTLGVNPDGRFAADIRLQALRAWCIIDEALAGLSANRLHLTRVRYYVRDASQWADVAEVHRVYFGGHQVTATLVAVAGFVDAAALIEIEVEGVWPVADG